MSTLWTWLAAEWPNIRPNLEASALWVPISVACSALVHHVQLRWHFRRHRELTRSAPPAGEGPT